LDTLSAEIRDVLPAGPVPPEVRDMPNETILNASELIVDAGVPEYNRRLTDKILDAFTHAYSIGETEIAQRLRAILVDVEEQGMRRYPGRRGNEAEEQAEYWVRFVEARDIYRRISQSSRAEPDQISVALEQMKEAYKHWSMR
jgi:hypothetical protein